MGNLKAKPEVPTNCPCGGSFVFQYAGNQVYRTYCDHCGKSPTQIEFPIISGETEAFWHPYTPNKLWVKIKNLFRRQRD